MLHHTRVLLAAAITLVIAPSVDLLCVIAYRLLSGYRYDIVDLERNALLVPELIVGSVLLMIFISIPMAGLWLMPAVRRLFARAWIAGLAGMLFSVLLAYPWLWLFNHSMGYGLSWQEFLRVLPRLPPLVLVTGSLFPFLHAFFIHRALAKKEWLASMSAHPSIPPQAPGRSPAGP